MSDYRKMGQAMRRRAGAASSSIGATPKTSVDIPDAVGSLMSAGSARFSVGAMTGKLWPKKNTQSADPSVMGPKARRTPVKVDANETLGACCKINAKMPTIDPAAGTTMASARTVPSSMGARQGFSGAASDSMR